MEENKMEGLRKNMVAALHKQIEVVIGEIHYSHVLKQAIGYTLLNWGKLFRPCLALMILNDLKGTYQEGIQYATAIEMIHVYGLLHDDLPALDDARYRRKKLVNHLVYGEAQTILAGDALQASAFCLIAKSDIEAPKILQLIKLMADMIGPNGYVGGQSLDIISEHEELQYIDAEMIQKIHVGKTGALIKASVMGAGIIAGVNHVKMQQLDKIADEIGLAFQIRDDIIDITKSEKELGKDSKSDLKKDKTTYPKVYGLKESEVMMQQHVASALGGIEFLLGKASMTAQYIESIFKL